MAILALRVERVFFADFMGFTNAHFLGFMFFSTTNANIAIIIDIPLK